MLQTILGIDYGLKRVGVAVGNTLTRNAEPLKVIVRNNDEQVVHEIQSLIKEWQASSIAIGVPRHPDGTPHEMTAACLMFIAHFTSLSDTPVIEVDERYSSVTITQKTTRKTNGKIRAAIQDDQAAAVILQQHLNSI